MTSVQQVIPFQPAPPAEGRRFRAYTAKHLDMLTERELGGLVGVKLYLQRVAVQGAKSLVDGLVE